MSPLEFVFAFHPPHFPTMAEVPPGSGDFARLFEGALEFELDPTASVGVVPAGKGKRGAALLHGDSPRLLLDRIADGDPLGLLERTNQRLSFQALLMDWHRATRRAMTYVAYLAARDRYRGNPPLSEFLDRGIDVAIESLIEEDWSADRRNDPIDPENDPYGSISLAADVDPAHARRVTLEFNLQPIALRRPLYCVLVDNKSFEEASERFGYGLDELRGHVRVMLERMLRGADTDAQLDSLLEDLEGGQA